MSYFGAARNAIHKLFRDNFSECPIFILNQTVDTQKLTEFVRVLFFPASTNQASFGVNAPVGRTTGTIIVEIYVKGNTGTKRLGELEDAVTAVIQRQVIRDENWSLQTRMSVPTVTGQQIDANANLRGPETTGVKPGDTWLQTNLQTKFWMDAR